MGFLAAIPAALGIGGGTAAGLGAGATTAGLIGSAAAAPMTGAAVGTGLGAGAGAGLGALSTAGLLSTAGPFLASLGGLTGDTMLGSLGKVASTGGKFLTQVGDIPLTDILGPKSNLDTLKKAADFGGAIRGMVGGGGEGGQQPLPPLPAPMVPQPVFNPGTTTRSLAPSTPSPAGYAEPTAYRTSQLMFGR